MSGVVAAKHAYLIIAHNEFGLLSKLIKLLDDERNDIYIHIDKKVPNNNIPQLFTTKASLFFVKRRGVTWGGDNMIWCELDLLKAATKKYHSYYHLISGVDLPIKSQDYIHKFFSENSKNYFNVYEVLEKDEAIRYRVRYYHLFQNKTGRNTGKLARIFEIAESIVLFIQKKLGVNRIKKDGLKLYKGGQWFSITHELAEYVISCEKKIKKNFRFSFCADEIFLQTVVMNSKFMDTLAYNAMRFIDWNRGAPYTFRFNDYNELMSSNMLFARKFSETTDVGIVNEIFDCLISQVMEQEN